jgi:hypothetical protein
MKDSDRKATTNGIWLCQNCAKMIDSDVSRYPPELLFSWKAEAEEEARARVGKTNTRTTAPSVRKAVAALQREHKLRDDLHRALLRTAAECHALPRFSNRSAKFLCSEVIIHRVGDTTYPEIGEGPGISEWFKLELLDFYHGGLHCILDLQHLLVKSGSRRWCPISYELSKESFPSNLSVEKMFVTGKIPWRNILHYDLSGDEFYPQPHFYCAFADEGQPYEGRGFFVLGDGREWELDVADRVELGDLLGSQCQQTN